MNDLQVPIWLKCIEISKILIILKNAKRPLRSMEIFLKLKEKGIIREKDFAPFSKMLCSILPELGLIKIVPSKGFNLYTVYLKESA